MDRPFRLIKSAKDGTWYSDEHKWWAPNDNSTFTKVPNNKAEFKLFEEKILIPVFGIKLADFGVGFPNK